MVKTCFNLRIMQKVLSFAQYYSLLSYNYFAKPYFVHVVDITLLDVSSVKSRPIKEFLSGPHSLKSHLPLWFISDGEKLRVGSASVHKYILVRFIEINGRRDDRVRPFWTVPTKHQMFQSSNVYFM